MLHLDARLVMPHILKLEKLHVRLKGRAGKLLGVDDRIHALDDQIVILLRRISSRRRRLAHKVVRGRH